VAAAYAAFAVPGVTQTLRSAGESGLVGIKLYDTGMRLLQVYGDPDEILPLGAVSATGGPGGRPAGGGKLGGGGGGGGIGAAGGGVSLNTPFDFGDQMFQEQALPDFQANGGIDGPPAGTRRGAAGGGGGAAGGGVGQPQSYL